MISLVKPRFSDEAVHNVAECVRSGWVSSQGKFVREFEDAMAKYLGVKHAVATSSGTTALHLALSVLGVTHADEVIVPSYTFIASANAVVYTGASPMFCDIDPVTWCIDVEDAKECITEVTRAIMPVHINGYPCNMDSIIKFALEHKLVIVEDACQALGGRYDDCMLGALSHVGCFSFFANKQLTTGEGGMCVTNSDEIAEELRTYRDHGREPGRQEYVHKYVGYNYRMTNMQAALGLSQISTLDDEVRRRRDLFETYRGILESNEYTQPFDDKWSPWLYQHRVKSASLAQKIASAITTRGIEARTFFVPVHKQSLYDNGSMLPTCESLHGIMLPLHQDVTESHIKIIKKVLETHNVIDS